MLRHVYRGGSELGVIESVRKELKITESELMAISDQDISQLLEAFSLLHFCPPPNIIEAVRVGFFYWSQLTWAWENMETFMLATINNILQDEGGVLYNKRLLYDPVETLDKKYNFSLSLGPAVLALASKLQLEDLTKMNYPFLEEFNRCLQADECRRRIDVEKNVAGE